MLPSETNPISTNYHASVTHKITRNVPWTEPGLRITRLRLLSDAGFPQWDVSYCHGHIGDEPVSVLLPFSHLPRRGMRRAIVKYAQADKVYAVGLGIFDNISTLI